MKQTEGPELGGYPRQTGGDTRGGAEVGSDPDPAEIHVTQEPIGLNRHTTSERVTSSYFFLNFQQLHPPYPPLNLQYFHIFTSPLMTDGAIIKVSLTSSINHHISIFSHKHSRLLSTIQTNHMQNS